LLPPTNLFVGIPNSIFMTNNIYSIYIKSHCEIPDFEAEAEARSEDEAMDIFYDMLRGEFDKEFIKQTIKEYEHK